ncbi:MAG: hypothetical protein JWO36_3854 [Myxococcales bacterium]|nr:hypothetical protein [Myxococcales bacterium]
MMAARLRRAVPYLILGVGFGLFLLYAFPGYTSSDSITQLEQARTHQYGDWHPPAMAALWTVVELAVRGPAGMLLLQGCLFLLGLYRILCRDFTDRSAAILASAIFLLPPIVAPMAVIWKDCQMAGFLLFGLSLVLDPRRPWRWGGVGLLIVGTAMRVNALGATFPIFVCMFGFVVGGGAPRWKRVLLAVALWLATVVSALAINRAFTRVEMHPWHCSIAPEDIVGVLKTSRKYTDAELLQVFEGTPLVVHQDIWGAARNAYSPTTWWYVTNGEGRVFDWPVTPEHRRALEHAWRTLVLGNPLSYVLHRGRMFGRVLALTNDPVFDAVWNVRLNMEQVGEPETTGIQGAIGDGLKWLAAHTFLFRPHVYFVLALLFLPLARRHADILGLLASGLCYELTLVIAAPSPDFRYSHWMIVCTILSTVLLIRRRSGVAPANVSALPTQSCST